MEPYLLLLFIILLLIFVGCGIYLFVRDLLTVTRKGRWGFNLELPHCPRCGEEVPAIRKPTSVRQALWGGWTCNKCGCEMDKRGVEIQKKAESAYVPEQIRASMSEPTALLAQQPSISRSQTMIREHSEISDETRTCPFCAETIKAAAITCCYCHRDLDTPQQKVAEGEPSPSASEGQPQSMRSSSEPQVQSAPVQPMPPPVDKSIDVAALPLFTPVEVTEHYEHEEARAKIKWLLVLRDVAINLMLKLLAALLFRFVVGAVWGLESMVAWWLRPVAGFSVNTVSFCVAGCLYRGDTMNRYRHLETVALGLFLIDLPFAVLISPEPAEMIVAIIGSALGYYISMLIGAKISLAIAKPTR